MTMSSTLRFVLAAALLAGALPQASVAETLVWTEKASGGFVTLTYGLLDPDKSPLFMLSCLNGMGIAVLDIRSDLPETKPGTPLTIELTSDGLTAPVQGEAAKDETSGASFGQASDIEVKPILDVLRGSGPVTVKVGTESATLSEHGRAEAVDKFGKDCELD
jgi:hypothetical protein